MIKLEDLKKDDIVYKAYEYFWMMKYKVVKEKHQFIIIDKVKYYTVTLKCLDEMWKNEKVEFQESDEKYLFRTKKEAKDSMKESCRLEKDYLLEKNNFASSLYYKAIGSMTDADQKLYKEVKEIIEKRNENGIS